MHQREFLEAAQSANLPCFKLAKIGKPFLLKYLPQIHELATKIANFS
jgi:hypothetical protein